MKSKNLTVLKAVGVTAGLNLLLAAVLLVFSRFVREDLGQAILFWVISLSLTLGVCLYGVISFSKRATLWASFGISSAVHLILSVAVTLLAGRPLSERWPSGGNLAWLLILVLSLTVWLISTLTVTVIRSYQLGHAIREERRQVNRAKKGYSMEWQVLSPGRGRLVAALRGGLWAVWLSLTTGLLFSGLTRQGLAETILSYAAFPTLWCLLAILYGMTKEPHRVTRALSAGITHTLLFLLSTLLLGLGNTPDIRHRFILHLDAMLNRPFEHPEQLLALGIFLSGWIAIGVFGVGNRKKTTREE